MAYQAGLGDVAGDIAAGLSWLQQQAAGVQTGADQLAEKIKAAGDYAVQISNAATGAAAGAKVGATAPTRTPSWVLPAAIVGAVLVLRR